MLERIENLVKLQELDLERARLTQQLRALPSEIAHAETSLSAAESRSAGASSALTREESVRTRLEREIEGHRQKAARFRAQLDSVKTAEQAQAIEHEIRFAQAETDRLENDEIASMERSEAEEALLAESRAQVESLAAALESIRARIALRQHEYADQIAALNAAREQVRERIEDEWLVRFDRLAAQRGTAIARVENQQCTGCRMGVRPQTWNQLREGQLLACDSCSRLLYWDPAMVPAPKAPQPESIPGAGRAIRKPRQAGA
ncbi:MAG: zinc ribbon domain-containing protein [Terracidiphilus sp.]